MPVQHHCNCYWCCAAAGTTTTAGTTGAITGTGLLLPLILPPPACWGPFLEPLGLVLGKASKQDQPGWDPNRAFPAWPLGKTLHKWTDFRRGLFKNTRTPGLFWEPPGCPNWYTNSFRGVSRFSGGGFWAPRGFKPRFPKPFWGENLKKNPAREENPTPREKKLPEKKVGAKKLGYISHYLYN